MDTGNANRNKLMANMLIKQAKILRGIGLIQEARQLVKGALEYRANGFERQLSPVPVRIHRR